MTIFAPSATERAIAAYAAQLINASDRLFLPQGSIAAAIRECLDWELPAADEPYSVAVLNGDRVDLQGNCLLKCGETVPQARIVIAVLPAHSGIGACMRSNIRADLSAGGETLCPDYVVTQFGIARIKGRAPAERLQNLLAVAHPDLRERLLPPSGF